MDNDYKPCPFCKESIRATAIKCRFCGEWLEEPVSHPAGIRPSIEAAVPPILEPAPPRTPVSASQKAPPPICYENSDSAIWQYQLRKSESLSDPLSLRQLAALAKSGEVDPETMIRKQGWETTKPAAEVTELTQAIKTYADGFIFGDICAYVGIGGSIAALGYLVINTSPEFFEHPIPPLLLALEIPFWSTLSYFLIRRDQRAINLSIIVAVIAVVGVLAMKLIPWNGRMSVLQLILPFYVYSRRHLLRRKDS